MIVRKTRPEEARRVNELFAIAFEQPLQNCPADPENEKVSHWAAFSDQGDMMSTLTVSDFRIHFDGNACLMGGIGGVATLPQYRRMGGIRGCFAAMLPDLYAKGYDFSYLYPFSTAYYRKFGYESCVQKYVWTVDLAQLSSSKPEGVFLLAEKHRPLAEAIQSLDTLWESRFNMMVRHDTDDYAWAREPDPAAKQEFTYVCFDAEGRPTAYTTFKTANESDGRNLVCSRFCFADRAGFYGLMGLFKSLSADHAHVKFQTPATPALQYLLPEWSLGAARWDLLASAGMVRAVNVRHVLEQARYLGSGRLAVRIRDPQIPENNGCFEVIFADGAALSVARSDGEPEAVMDISAFSALIAGVCGFDDARHCFSSLEVRVENPCFRQAFYPKPLMIADYF